MLGELTVVSFEGGQTITGRDAVYDLGTVYSGRTAKGKIVIRNVGVGRLRLVSLERFEGNVEVLVGNRATGDAPPVFSVEAWPPGTELGVNEVLELEVAYAPPVEEASEHEVKLLLQAANAMEGTGTAQITLRGRSSFGDCEGYGTLDFGSVVIGEAGHHGFELTNPTLLPLTALVGEITSAAVDRHAFRFGADSAPGEQQIAPGGTKTVTIEFWPSEDRSYLSFIKVQRAKGCFETSVILKGEGM